jgi:hypothetical protein
LFYADSEIKGYFSHVRNSDSKAIEKLKVLPGFYKKKWNKYKFFVPELPKD